MTSKRRKHLTPVVTFRGRIGNSGGAVVLSLLSLGWKKRAIARRLKISPSSVRRWAKKHPVTKTKSKATPRAVIERRRKVVFWAKQVTDRVASEIIRVSGLRCSARTIRRDFRALGAKALVRPKGPARFPGDAQCRVLFCRRLMALGYAYMLRLVFSDEKMFSLSDQGVRMEWVFKNESRRVREQVQAKRIHVWGAIGPNNFGLLVIFPPVDTLGPRHLKYKICKPKAHPDEHRGRPRLARTKQDDKPRKGIDSECFIDLVGKELVRLWKPEFILEQDGASIHHTSMVLHWFHEHGVDLLPSWPKRSPDLSPIENVWSCLQYRVSRLHPSSNEQLEDMLLKEFEELDTTALYNSFPDRVKECLRVNGETIHSGKWRLSASQRQYRLLHPRV